MRCNYSLLTLSSMATKLIGASGGETLSEDTELDDLFQKAKGMATGTDRDARMALSTARAVLRALVRYAALLAGLAGSGGHQAVDRERGRWQELLDATRVRLAKGGPVLIHQARRRSLSA